MEAEVVEFVVEWSTVEWWVGRGCGGVEYSGVVGINHHSTEVLLGRDTAVCARGEVQGMVTGTVLCSQAGVPAAMPGREGPAGHHCKYSWT